MFEESDLQAKFAFISGLPINKPMKTIERFQSLLQLSA